MYMPCIDYFMSLASTDVPLCEMENFVEIEESRGGSHDKPYQS